MKKVLLTLLIVLSGCGVEEGIVTIGVVEEFTNEALDVKFNYDNAFQEAYVSSDVIDPKIQIGDLVAIQYDGTIAESYPVMIHANRVDLYISFHQAPSYRKISPAIAKLMMDLKNVMMIDVRDESEYAASHIEGAVHIPFEEVTTQVKKQVTNKEQIILLYSREGVQSEQAAKALVEIGYANVFDFGSIQDWTYGVVR